jgi:4-amino-4-deoxy-L-arabinose transferase-like glycosyltransferase
VEIRERGKSLGAATSRAGWIPALLFAIFFLATNAVIAQRRLLWFDEINTINLAKLPDISSLWQIQNSFRADSAPIVYHLFVRFMYTITGHAEMSARLLSSIAMVAAMLIVFDCTRRFAGNVAGLTAICILGCSFLTYHGYEGRPYALVTMFTAMALWVWLFAPPGNPLTAPAFGLAICLAVAMHFNAVLAIVPFAAWELLHWRPWKMPSAKLIAGCVGILLALAPSLQQMSHSAKWAKSFWCPPTLHGLTNILGEMFPSGLFFLCVFVLCVAVWGAPIAAAIGGPIGRIAGTRNAPQPMSDSERLCWLFLTVPLAGFIVAKAVTNAYYDRYLISTLPGVAVALAAMIARNSNRLIATGLLVLLACSMIFKQVGTVRAADDVEPPSAQGQQRHTRETLDAEAMLLQDGKKYVITDFQLLDELQYYSKHANLYMMYRGDDLSMECEYFGDACFTEDAIEKRAAETAAIYPTSKLLADFRKAGYFARIVRTEPMMVYFSRP